MKRFLSFLWLAGMACLYVHFSYNGVDIKEKAIAVQSLAIWFFALTFPGCLLVILIGLGLKLIGGDLLSYSSSTVQGAIVDDIFWLSLVAVGYWQWFILVPKLIAKIKKRRGRVSEEKK